VIYEIRYPKLLTFNEIYKNIINPYFILPQAQYVISNEGTHNESIQMTFPESNHYLIFRNDRIGIYYDGTINDLLISGSHLDNCYDIFSKLKENYKFLNTLTEILEIVGFVESNKENDFLKEFASKNNLKRFIKQSNDFAIIEEGKLDENNIRIEYGPFFPEKDIITHSLFNLNLEEKLKFENKNGLIIKCSISRKNIDKISKRSFKIISKISENIVNDISKYYE